jgi:hypothetical protein
MFQDEELKELQDRLPGNILNNIIVHICNFKDLCNGVDLCSGRDQCNGSGRLAEISTMMILLPASLVLLISFSSRL